MATTHHTVAAALLLVLGSFAATTPPADAAFPFGSASQAVPTLIPFPAGRFPHLGALQSLPALQCRLAAGVNGSFGASLGDTPFSRGRRTCAAPVVDVTEVIAVLGAHVQGRQRWTPDLAAQMAQQLRSMATQASNQSGLVVENAVFFPVHRRASDLTRDAGGGGDLRVDFRNGLANVLTLTRSTDSGAVWRHSGKYEVLAITSVVRGVCLTADCSVVAAVDTTGRGACSASACDTPHDSRDVAGRVDSEDAVTVVTHTSPRRGGGGPQPVSVVQLGLLGLGRAVHVARRWLISPPWDLTATVHTQLVTPPTRFEEFTHEPSLTSAWPLGGEAAAEAAKRDHVADAGGSEWLQKVAIALCHEPLPAYVDRRLCRGIAGNGQTPPTVKVSYNGAPEDLHVLRDALEPSTGAVWRVAPARHEATDAEPCAFADNLTAVRGADGAGRGPMEPPWMAGTLSREIHSRSPDEVELARSLGRCRLATGAAASGLAAIGSLRGREQLARHAAVVRLASSLHAGDYGDLEHPDDPASPTAKAEAGAVRPGLGGAPRRHPYHTPSGRARARLGSGQAVGRCPCGLQRANPPVRAGQAAAGRGCVARRHPQAGHPCCISRVGRLLPGTSERVRRGGAWPPRHRHPAVQHGVGNVHGRWLLDEGSSGVCGHDDPIRLLLFEPAGDHGRSHRLPMAPHPCARWQQQRVVSQQWGAAAHRGRRWDAAAAARGRRRRRGRRRCAAAGAATGGPRRGQRSPPPQGNCHHRPLVAGAQCISGGGEGARGCRGHRPAPYPLGADAAVGPRWDARGRRGGEELTTGLGRRCWEEREGGGRGGGSWFSRRSRGIVIRYYISNGG